tara:strand:- start:201 stop:353 length:153 start_codon:yes stop_codon:yes gene_type:complete
MSKNDLTKAELKQLINTITFFQLGARTKELKTIKLKLKNQLKEMESNASI